MSQPRNTALDKDTVEILARTLAAAVSTRRSYAPEHSRCRSALDGFLHLLQAALRETVDNSLAFVVVEGRLAYEGAVVGARNHAITEMARALAERGCSGLAFTATPNRADVAGMLNWLGERTPRPPPRLWPGIDTQCDAAAAAPGRSVEAIREFNLSQQVYQQATRIIEHVMDDVRAGRNIDYGEIAQFTTWTSQAAFDQGVQLVTATQSPRQAAYTFSHNVNVFLLATALLQPFARNPRELARFSQAALLHDVGKTRIPPDILYKKGKLTDEEFDVFRRHPEFGAEILLRNPHVDPLAVEVAYCHHMRDDGLGYPRPNLPIKPGPVTGIVQVADMFEALTSTQPHHVGMSTEDAVRTILNTPGMRGRRDALALLLQRLTNSPPGSGVRLQSGARGVVLRTHDDRPSHPVVRIDEDAEGNPMSPIEIDLKESSGDVEQPIVEVYLKPGVGRTGPEDAPPTLTVL